MLTEEDGVDSSVFYDSRAIPWLAAASNGRLARRR
jgi:hypothetical protein